MRACVRDKTGKNHDEEQIALVAPRLRIPQCTYSAPHTQAKAVRLGEEIDDKRAEEAEQKRQQNQAVQHEKA